MKTRLTLAVALAATAVGCGSTSAAKPTTNTLQVSTKTTSNTIAATLDAAVRRAVIQNSQLSFYTLRYDAIPAWAQISTRGPALVELRASAVQRRHQRIQVHHISGHLKIVSIRLDPSYVSATAIVRADDRVRPYRDGKPMGQSVEQTERARIELHRLGRLSHFVVWKVTLLR
jgi:hypothetical protein